MPFTDDEKRMQWFAQQCTDVTIENAWQCLWSWRYWWSSKGTSATSHRGEKNQGICVTRSALKCTYLFQKNSTYWSSQIFRWGLLEEVCQSQGVVLIYSHKPHDLMRRNREMWAEASFPYPSSRLWHLPPLRPFRNVQMSWVPFHLLHSKTSRLAGTHW